jgi:hypothetical protein
MPVPVDLQISLASRILSFDHELKSRVGDEIVIGIVYQDQFRSSLNARDAFLEAHRSGIGTEITGLPVRCVPLAFRDTARLAEAAVEHDLDVLYIAPLRAVSIGALANLSRRRHILTITGVPEYVANGIAVGIGSEAGRPKILINLDGANAEGADFSSELLKLSQIVAGDS